MKKLNLIKRLWTDSHEKQSPQRFARYAAMLLLLLTCVTHAWADDYYLRGLSSSNWDASAANKMAAGSNNIVWMSHATDGGYVGFKITKGTSYAVNYGQSSGNVSFGAPYTMTQGASNNAYTDNWSSGTYYYYFNTSTRVLTVYNTIEVKGALMSDGWSSTTAMTFQSGGSWKQICSATLTGGSSYNFKIHANGTYTGYSSKVSCTNGTASAENGNDGDNIQVTPTHGGTAVVVFHPEANGTINIYCPYEIAYNKGANGTGTIASGSKTWNASFTLSSSTFTRAGYTQDGWSTSDGGGKVYNLGGSYTANADVTLYPHWSENKSTVTLVSSPASKGTFTVGGSTVTSTQAGVATTPSVTAVPIDGYHFVSWSITGGASVSSTTTNPTTVTGGGAGTAATLTATFAADDVYTLTVAAGTGISAVSGTTNNIKAGDDISITATVASGYTWSTWTKTGTGTLSTYTAGTKNQTVTVGTAGDITLTASATEDKVTLTPTVSYDHGTSSYTASADNKIGVSTTSRIKCSKPNTDHYTFAGWDLTNLTVTSGDEDSDTIIYVKVTTPGSAVAAVAKYEEVLEQDTWVLKGGESITGDDWSKEHALTKKSGYSTSDVVYYTVESLTALSPASGEGSTANSAYNFKIVKKGASDTWFGLSGDGDYWYYRSTGEQTMTSSSSQNIQVRADVTGDYEIKVDYSDPSNPTVTVTFPTSYTLTYSLGTVPGTSGSISSSPTTSSGSYIVSGSTVTLTAPSEKTGYTWKGWYPNADGSGVQQCSTKAYAVTVSANTTTYACYTEDKHTVTVTAGAHGSITTPAGGSGSTVSAGIATGASIVASPADGYWFGEWTTESGSVTFANKDNASTTVTATEDSEIKANFVSQWVVGGSFNSWNMRQYGVENFGTNASSQDTGYVEISLAANTEYTFKLYNMDDATWWSNSDEATYYIEYAENNKQGWDFASGKSKDCGLKTAGAGTYKFAWNMDSKKIAVHFPTSYTVTYGYGTGGSAVGASVEGATAITSGQYATENKDITFAQTPATGYTFKGWYDASSGGTAISSMASDNVYDDIAADISVYAQYTENMTTVALMNNGHGHVEIGGDVVTSTTAGMYTTRSITAVPDAGYYFSGWTVVEGTDFSVAGTGEAYATTTLTGGGTGETSGQTLRANFTELDKIYFQNIVNWTSVYVYFGPAWDESHTPSYGVWVGDVTHYAMTRLDSKSDIWWAYIPRGYTKSPNGKIAFSDYDFGNDTNFEGHNGAYRGDFNSTLDCYVPIESDPFHETSYYSNGYWMMYGTTSGESVGYELWRYAKDEKSSSKVGDFKATADGAHTSEYVHRIDDADATYKYFVKSVGGENYASSELITSDNCEAIQLYHYNSDPKTSVTYTTEGDYTFILAQGNGSMFLTVDYPVAVGDYQLVYYTTASRAAETPDITSDVIKAAKASTAVMTSMYINKDASGVILKLQECTSIDDKTKEPVWEDVTGATGLISSFAGKAKGVYQFTITASTRTIGSIEPYAGEYYIKTDCAPGGWADYKKNVMEKNTINAENAGFDYYFCRWIGGTTTNVKCVIANDYNNAISDTLYSDAILTRSAIEYQTLPEAGNVRFSYDTKTNTLKRTYLLGSTMSNHFVELKPNEAGYVYRESGATTDIYSNATEFGDNGNWTYIMDAYVYPGAKGGVETTYPSSDGTTQTLVPTTNTLMGGTKPGVSPVTYHVKLVYDFKTDYLMSAYIPNGSPVTSAIDLQTDMMYVRNGEGASTQLSFSGSGKLTNVERAYGVFEFPKDEMSGQMSSWLANDYQAYKYCRYYFSFPFDVKVIDIFGVGEYGKEFIIQKYNGVKRAEIGWFMETETFWETVDVSETLSANVGYSLMLDREEFNRTDGKGVWTNIDTGHSIYLFFPSTKTAIGTIDAINGNFTVTEHLHTSGRTWTKDAKTLNHDETDSNWGLIGLPAYASTYPNDGTNKLDKCYTYNPEGNTWSITDLEQRSSLLKSMHAYMVQYAGTFDWTTVAPSPIVARNRETTTNMTVQLNLMYNDAEADRAFVKLEEDADKGFVLNEDMYKMVNKGKSNIYVYAGDYDVAYSTTSVESQTVEVGVIISKSGEYTFSMPKNINGTVTLIDKFAQTRTNLAIEDYEVYLNKGTINDRFELEINIKKVPTAIDGVEDGSFKDGKAHKFIENGLMYILRDGKVYDAQGNRVK